MTGPRMGAQHESHQATPAIAAATGRGELVIVSGPSGAGKTTVLRRVFERAAAPLVASVSATTRSPRPGERDGHEYHFLAEDEFQRRRQRGEFLECFEVFGRGVWYGTLRSEVEGPLAAGKWVLLEIDVRGALSVMEQFPEAISIFLKPGSLAEVERRLRGRATETEEAIQRRLKQAEFEISQSDRYRYQVINDDVDQAADEICGILSKHRELKQA